LEYRILDNCRPYGPMFLVTGFESFILLLSERPSALAACLFEEWRPVGQGGTNLGRKMCACVWVMFLVRIREVCTKAGKGTRVQRGSMVEKKRADRSLRSTDERLSNSRLQSLKIVFQFPTPCLAQVRPGFRTHCGEYALGYNPRRASVSLRGSIFCEVFSLAEVQLGLTFGLCLF